MGDQIRQAEDPERLAERRREEQRPVEEAGGGVAEGFEQAEAELEEHASHGDQHNTTPIVADARDEDEESDAVYGEPDGESPATADRREREPGD